VTVGKICGEYLYLPFRRIKERKEELKQENRKCVLIRESVAWISGLYSFNRKDMECLLYKSRRLLTIYVKHFFETMLYRDIIHNTHNTLFEYYKVLLINVLF
jgi:hypothetical protein